MTTNIRWGIAGAGTVAALFAAGLADSPGAELVAVASQTRTRAEALASRFGARRVHVGYEALAEDREVDIVYVATPNSDHRARAMMMLEAGKAVVCEKPFALDAATARDIVAVAERKRLFCMEAMWMRFMPAVRELLAMARGGVLGRMESATIELGHPFAFDAGHRLFRPELGGGALLDLGVYAVSLAVALFGAPTRVQSQASFGASGVDEHVTALLGHRGGAQTVIGASLRTRLANGASIAGTEAWARLHEPLYRPSVITVVRARQQALGGATRPAGLLPRRAEWIRSAYQRLRTVPRKVLPGWTGGGRTQVRAYRGNGYCHEAIEAMRCLRAGSTESPEMPLAETLLVMETLDAIRAAWRQS